MSPATLPPAGRRPVRKPPRRPRALRRVTSLFANGEPWIWLTGGALLLALFMISALLGLVLWFGASTFWPGPLLQVELQDGRVLLGELDGVDNWVPDEAELAGLDPESAASARAELAASEDGTLRRRHLRTGNYDLQRSHFEWVRDCRVTRESRPEWALVVERTSWGRFYGTPVAFRIDGEVRADDPEAAWGLFREVHGPSRERLRERRRVEEGLLGRVNARLEEARLDVRRAELAHGEDSDEAGAAAARLAALERDTQREFDDLGARLRALDAENARYELVLRTAQGVERALQPGEIVRAWPANRLGTVQRLGVYLSRWSEFLTDEPRNANSEGGVLPAIVGTVFMTLVMSFLVVPFGVLAALYLREYAHQGALVAAVRIAVNNLAGVPSIVFGVFGLGFFCYVVGAGIDGVLFEERLPNPTFGTGGLLWASLTLALLTLPVVIVATEESLASVPNSMREGSYACGATKWQTIRRIVLPRAAPGIMTGMILAIARGAGEVAPLMLVGAAKLAPRLPFDGEAPFLHPSRSFMHLGFHLYDLGFQSQNSEAAKPMVYTTTLLLIALIVVLNLVAVRVRAHFRRKFHGTHV